MRARTADWTDGFDHRPRALDAAEGPQRPTRPDAPGGAGRRWRSGAAARRRRDGGRRGSVAGRLFELRDFVDHAAGWRHADPHRPFGLGHRGHWGSGRLHRSRGFDVAGFGGLRAALPTALIRKKLLRTLGRTIII